MNPIKIKVEIAKRGLTQTQIANEIGTRPDMISQMVNGFRYYPRIAAQIEEKFGIVIPPPKSKHLAGVKPEKLAA